MRRLLLVMALVINFAVWASDFTDGNKAYVNKDYATAAEKFKSAAEQGDARAQSVLGFMYKHGQSVAQDYTEAAHWYKLAAAQGDGLAQLSLGVMYDRGEGVAQDYVQAVRLYKLAAEKGIRKAQYNLGLMYEHGLGIAQNYIQAHLWFNLAASHGHKEKVERRNRIAKLMTPQQIAQAQKLATECLARNYKRCN